MDKIYCFDLDGTISKKEILPILAKEIDLFEEMEALTEATIKGILPFNRSFNLRVKLLQEIPVSKIQDIVMEIPLHEYIVEFIKHNKDKSYVITGNLDVWIGVMINNKLGCKFFSSKANMRDNKIISITEIVNKGKIIKELKGLHKKSKIISIGDGMGDVQMNMESDIGIAYGSVHQPIETLIRVSDYIIFEERSLCRLLNML